MITGANHYTLSVKDLESSFQFYSEILGLTPIAKGEHFAYFRAGDFWIAIVDDREMNAGMGVGHFAFSVKELDFNAVKERIIASGTKVWKENETEGNSLYFADPSGNRLEIHVGSLESRLKSFKNSDLEIKLFEEQ